MRFFESELHARAEQQHGVIAVRSVYELGATRRVIARLVDSGQWHRPCRGVLRRTGSPRTWRQRMMTGVLAAGPTAIASHRSAAALLGLSGFREGPVELVLPGHGTRRCPVGPVRRSLALADHHRTTVDGIPCTTPVRTVFDLLGVVHPRWGERILDRALADRRFDVAMFEALVDEIGARGRAGTATARELLQTRSGGAYVPPESELESRLLAVLRDGGLPEPERQVIIGGEYAITGRVDFWYPDAALIIEADGRRWHDGFTDEENDGWRDLASAAAGCQTLHVTWRQLTQRPADVVRLVAETRRMRLRQLNRA